MCVYFSLVYWGESGDLEKHNDEINKTPVNIPSYVFLDLFLDRVPYAHTHALLIFFPKLESNWGHFCLSCAVYLI